MVPLAASMCPPHASVTKHAIVPYITNLGYRLKITMKKARFLSAHCDQCLDLAIINFVWTATLVVLYFDRNDECCYWQVFCILTHRPGLDSTGLSCHAGVLDASSPGGAQKRRKRDENLAKKAPRCNKKVRNTKKNPPNSEVSYPRVYYSS